MHQEEASLYWMERPFRRIDNAGDSILQLSENARVITLAADGRTKAEITRLLAGKQETITNYSVTGSTLLNARGLLKRLVVTLDIALGVPLTVTENTTTQLTLDNYCDVCYTIVFERHVM